MTVPRQSYSDARRPPLTQAQIDALRVTIYADGALPYVGR
jgi:hypothetical protein